MSTENMKPIELSLLSAALHYAAIGWPVIPLHSFADGMCTCEKVACSSAAKHPLTPNGVHGATTDEQTIRIWWSQAETANVGIATGKGLFVLDIDAKHGGFESLTNLENQHGKLPTTPTVITGGGGRHYYFRLADGVKIGNRAGIAPGIDVRGDAGYVAAVPSLHASGRHYEWLHSLDTPLAEAPAWLMAKLSGCEATKSVTHTTPSKTSGLKLRVQPATDDLANHPGAGEGQRNATLCQLIGVHLAREDDVDDIERLAIAWGGLCSPPMNEDEILRTLNSLSAKHQKSAIIFNSDDNDDLDALILPDPPQWPPIDAAAWHGLMGEIVRTIEPETEADPIGILTSSLVVFGNAVGRGPHYPVEGNHHHANLFVVCVGESSRGRKGTSLGRALSLFDTADPEWKRNGITTGLSSGEGLIWAVRDPLEVFEPIKEKGTVTGYHNVIKERGVTDKRCLVIEPEFAQTLKVLKREGNTLSPVLRQGWDSGVLTAMTKNNFARATDTHISILAHITRPELAKCLSDTDCLNGFANRFVWPLVRRSKLLPDGGRDLDLSSVQEQMAKALAKAKTIGEMNRSPGARELWHQLYPGLTAERHGLYGAVVGRGEAQTLRLSMLFALLDGTSIIDVAHLKAAYAIWRYCEDSARIIFSEGQADASEPLGQLLLQIIRKTPGINRRGLHKAIGGHIPAKELIQALAKLRDTGEVRCEVNPTGGRPAECWFPKVIRPPHIVMPIPVAKLPDDVQTIVEMKPVENQPPPAMLTLPELFDAVTRIGGGIRREGDSCIVDSPAASITDDIKAALAKHQETLLRLLPQPAVATSESRRPGQDEIIPDDEFWAALRAM